MAESEIWRLPGDRVRVREISEIDVHPAGEERMEMKQGDTTVKGLCCLSLRCFQSSRFPDTRQGGGRAGVVCQPISRKLCSK